jgi:hypothetical protein
MDTVGFIATYIAPLAFVPFHKAGNGDLRLPKIIHTGQSRSHLILEPSGVATTLPSEGKLRTDLIPPSSVRIGDLILLEKNERVPADAATSGSSGMRFIGTDQLDGEANWKLRAAVSACQKLCFDSALLSLDAKVPGVDSRLPLPLPITNPVHARPIRQLKTFAPPSGPLPSIPWSVSGGNKTGESALE